jgi:diguanylate cyclase (GGDEF)-like protein/PAS domain S-box-containing protein
MDFSDQSLSNVLESLHDGLYFTDRNRRIIYWNPAAERITGFAADEVLGKHCCDNILVHVDADGQNLCQGSCPLAQTIDDGLHRESEVYLHHKTGHRVPVSVRVTPLVDKSGQVIGGIELFTDISNRDATEIRLRELQQLALLDHLTQLANRAYLERELNSRLEELKRTTVSFAIIFIDIDHFKQVNDTHGHLVGDQVLKLVAKTLTVNARPFDLYGRWGGEEFLGIIRNIDLPDLEQLCQRLLVLVETSWIDTVNPPFNVTISIGATIATAEDSLQSLTERADELLYQSKNSGRNCASVAVKK